MTGDDIKKMADGYPPISIGMDHEEVVVWMAKHSIQLQQQVRALAAENSALARYFSASSVAVNHWNSWADTVDKLACAPETPATDAALREIRAQVLDDMAEDCEADWPDNYVEELRASAASIRSGEQP